jgi:hypothetical protein
VGLWGDREVADATAASFSLYSGIELSFHHTVKYDKNIIIVPVAEYRNEWSSTIKISEN